MTIAKHLISLPTCDWGDIRYGFFRRWLSAGDVAEFSVRWMLCRRNEIRVEIIELAGGDLFSDDEVIRLLSELCPNVGAEPSARWIYAFIADFLMKNPDDGQWSDRFEELYADLGYPAILEVCSKFYVPPSASNVKVGDQTDSPLQQLRDLFIKMRDELELRTGDNAVKDSP